MRKLDQYQDPVQIMSKQRPLTVLVFAGDRLSLFFYVNDAYRHLFLLPSKKTSRSSRNVLFTCRWQLLGRQLPCVNCPEREPTQWSP